MEAIDLHYGKGKLIRLGLLALLMGAAALWLALEGADAGSGGRRGRALFDLLGPSGVQALGWILATVSILFAFLYLRRAFGDPVAARTDSKGVTLYTLFGTHHYAASDIDRFVLERPMGQPILQLYPLPGRAKKRGLAANGLAEDEEEVEAWIEATHARLREGADGAGG